MAMTVVALLGLVAAGLVLCLVLFLFAKMELARLAKRSDNEARQLRAAVENLGRALAELELNLRDLEERTGVLVPPAPPRSGLNLTTRAQALRMLRRGETPSRIAAALHVPENEIRLLMKVQELTSAPEGPPG
ncbi:MAG: hypothetical protein RMI94_06290 [Bryobacterales bacterium]|nr:hypothetical protein [Bryobacteraceae bacterium]MDW8130139.1 hypothetical protein [Bryobacterales bacterium]